MFLVLALAASVPFTYEGRLNPGQTLAIRDLNGGVRVRTGDRLVIHATKHANHGDPNAVQIHVDSRPDGLVVCVRYPPNAARGCDEHTDNSVSREDNDTTVDFDVTIPRGVVLNAAAVNGSVDAITDGPITAKAVNGNVHAEGRDVRSADAVNGSVTVRILDRGNGPLDVKTVNGSIDVTLPPGSGANVTAKSVTGDIAIPGLTVDRPRYGPGARASGTLGDGARRIDLKTVTGTITLHR